MPDSKPIRTEEWHGRLVEIPHRYERDPQSGAGNCWCGWPEMWGDRPPPIHDMRGVEEPA